MRLKVKALTKPFDGRLATDYQPPAVDPVPSRQSRAFWALYLTLLMLLNGRRVLDDSFGLPRTIATVSIAGLVILMWVQVFLSRPFYLRWRRLILALSFLLVAGSLLFWVG